MGERDGAVNYDEEIEKLKERITILENIVHEQRATVWAVLRKHKLGE